MFTLSEAATVSFDALRLLRMSRRGGVEGASLASLGLHIHSKDPTTTNSVLTQFDKFSGWDRHSCLSDRSDRQVPKEWPRQMSDLQIL
jgi:hypothetical protein